MFCSVLRRGKPHLIAELLYNSTFFFHLSSPVVGVVGWYDGAG